MKANLPPWPDPEPPTRMVWASDASEYVPVSEARWCELTQAYVRMDQTSNDTTRDRRDAVREDAWPGL